MVKIESDQKKWISEFWGNYKNIPQNTWVHFIWYELKKKVTFK